jgi:hypothetical protein
VDEPDEAVADDEGDRPVETARLVVEGLRDRQARDEHRDHDDDQRGPEDAAVAPDVVGEPGVGAPRPPEQGEDDRSLDERPRSRAVRHERGHLGEREHVDEVEEELEGRDAVALL